MSAPLTPATVLSGLSETLSSETISEDGNEHFLLRHSIAGQRDFQLGTWTFNDAETYYVSARKGAFWMMPTWTDDLQSLPQTRPGGDLAFVMARRTDGHCILLLPLATPAQRGRLSLDDGLRAALRSDPGPRDDQSEAPAFLLSLGPDPLDLLTSSLKVARKQLDSFRLRHEKAEPAFIDTLGWCTWDAYYRDVTAARVEQGVAELAGGGHSPGFLIIDDGWQDVSDGWGLHSFIPNSERFPDGLGSLARRLRSNYGLRWVGVWHTLQGYWGGVDPAGPLAKRYPLETTLGAMEIFKGWPSQYTIDSRVFVSHRHIATFFLDYYEILAEQGVNLVKVDNQAQLELFSQRDDLPENAIRHAYQNALQGAASTHMQGNLLHCMNQSSEIYFQLSVGNLARNSDDFYPKKDDAAQIKHIVQNAFNAAFTRHFCIPDWDMFHTYHRCARLHAIGRVISGGPVYVSDQPQSTDHDLLDQLVVGENRILRFAQAGRPLARQFFKDPRESEQALVVANPHQGGFGAVALFNCDAKAARPGSFGPYDLPELTAERFAVYDYQSQRLSYLSREGSLSCELPAAQAALFALSPVIDECACLGLRGKLNGIAALQSATQVAARLTLYRLSHGGEVLFASPRLPRSAIANGKLAKARPALGGEAFIVACESDGPVEIILETDPS